MVLKIFLAMFSTQVLAADCKYYPPFTPGNTHRIIQGFKGKYSHFPPLQYGVDFEMPKGTLIYSARAGTVIKVISQNRLGGPDKRYLKNANKIVIDHNDGSFSLYAHLKKNSSRVKTGQIISSRFPIARSGCTGWCDGPHLHFEVFTKKKNKRESMPFKFKTSLGCTLPNINSQVTNKLPKRRYD